MTKIHVISGFLGAGKTTLIKKLIGEALQGQKVVLIENEFGEIAIDGGFLKDAGIQITEMSSGCICCSLVGDFSKALKEVVEKYHPDQILIEPSGVGKLSDVLHAIEAMPDVQLGGAVTVADAGKTKMYIANFGEFFLNQIQYAGTIILSRTQKLTQEKLEQCVALLRQSNEKASIITTPWDDISGEKMMSVIEQQDSLVQQLLQAQEDDDDDEHECCHHHHDDDDDDEHECCHHHHDGDDDDEHECCHHHHDDDDDDEHECHHHHDGEGHHHHHHGHDADEVFTSWGTETVKKFTKEEISFALEQLGQVQTYGIVLRAKGILPTCDGGWLQFDYVPDEPSVRMGSADYTGRLCVIGSKLQEENLKKLFGV